MAQVRIVKWSKKAVSQIENIIDYIALDFQWQAERVANKIYE